MAINYGMFLTPATSYDPNAAVGNALSGMRMSDQRAQYAQTEERLRDQFERDRQLQASRDMADMYQRQQAHDLAVQQEQQRALQDYLKQIQADPQLARLSGADRILEIAGIGQTPPPAPPAPPTPPTQVAPPGSAIGTAPAAPSPAAKGPEKVQSVADSVTLEEEPETPEQALERAQQNRDRAEAADTSEPDSSYTGEPPPKKPDLSRSAAAAVLPKAMKSMRGPVTEDYANAQPPEEVQRGIRDIAPQPGVASPGEIEPSKFTGNPEQEAASNARIDRALAAAKSTLQASPISAAPQPMPGDRGLPMADLEGIEQLKKGRAANYVRSFVAGYYPQADRKWVESVVAAAEADPAFQGIRDEATAEAYLGHIVEILKQKEFGRVAMNKPRTGPQRDVLDFDRGVTHASKYRDDPGNKKVLEALPDIRRTLDTMEKDPNAVSDAMLQRSFAKAMNSGSLSEADAKAPEQFMTWKQKAESFIQRGFKGGMTPEERQMIREALKDSYASREAEAHQAYEDEMSAAEEALPDSALYRKGFVSGMTRAFGKFPWFERDRVRAVIPKGGEQSEGAPQGGGSVSASAGGRKAEVDAKLDALLKRMSQ